MNHLFITSFVFGGLLASCQHKPLNEMPKPSSFKININYDAPAIDCSPCKPIPSPAREIGIIRVDWLQVYPYFLKFCVNPKNSNEIVYHQITQEFKVDMTESIQRAYYYNLKSKQKQLLDKDNLLNRLLSGQPRWHSNGWVLLSKSQEVLKWHPKGSSVSLSTDISINCGAVWNPEGTQLAYFDRQGGIKIVDTAHGKLLNWIQNFPINTPYLDWTKPDTLVFQQEDGVIVTYDIKSSKFDVLVPSQGGHPTGFCWLNDSKTMIFSTLTGLYITNTKTKQVKKIKCACQSIRYDCPIYVPQLHKIYALRVETQALNPPQNAPIMTQKKLVSMNIDGSEEQVIDLPQ